MPPHGRRASSTVPSPCGHGRERAKPYSVKQRPYSVCTLPPMASKEAGPPSGGHWWPPGDLESLHKFLTMPPHGRRANSTVPLPLAGTVTSGQSPILSGNGPIPSCTPPPMASREAGPPSGGHRRPPCSLPAGARWNRLAAFAWASSEFYEGSASRRERSRAGKALFRRATPLFHRAPCRPCGGIVSHIPSGNALIPSCTPPPLTSREAEPPSGGHWLAAHGLGEPS